MSALDSGFLTIPLAHRGLHDRAAGRAENSLSAVSAAVATGYGVEIDLQLSADGRAMVFHDYDLARLTGREGRVSERTAAELGALRLGGGEDTIPELSAVLAAVAGKAPVLIEIKDQHGALGPTSGALERATADALQRYTGPVAVMSFNPHSIAAMAELAPEVPRGLTTCAFLPVDWPRLGPDARQRLVRLPDLGRVGASFVSHDATDLASAELDRVRAQGLGILCWTIRSQAAERAARKIADNITFEGYLPRLPGLDGPAGRAT